MPVSDIARAAEDRFHRDLIPVLRAHGWHPRAVPYDGYGLAASTTPPPPAAAPAPERSSPHRSAPVAAGGPQAAPTPAGSGPAGTGPGGAGPAGAGTGPAGTTTGSMVRVMARMLMRPTDASAEGPLFQHLPDRPPRSAGQAAEIARESWLDAQRGWRQFIDAPVPYLPVTITVGGRRVRTRADRGGYVDVVVRDHGLGPGWHEATLEAAGAAPVTARVHVIAPGPRLGIVCDIDDTVMVTGLPRALIAGWNVLVRSAAAREPVPGMPQLLTNLLHAHPSSPLVYLSTGAWNVVPTLRSFFTRTGLPHAPMLMTDWGPTNTGWFRSGPDHKRTALRRLLIDLPQVRWLLIGDDGQHDPLVYSELAREHSDRVAAVAIRRLSGREQVLAGTALVHPLAHPQGIGPVARALAESPVPIVWGRDGHELASALPAGLLA